MDTPKILDSSQAATRIQSGIELENRISARTLFARSFNLLRWQCWMLRCGSCCCCCCCFLGRCCVWLLLVVDCTANILIVLDEITGLGQYPFLFPAGERGGAFLQQAAAARHLVLLVCKAIVERLLGEDDASLRQWSNGGIGHCRAAQMGARLSGVMGCTGKQVKFHHISLT